MKKCKKHPTYKAIRKPTAKCQACWDIWNAKQIPRQNAMVRFDFTTLAPDFHKAYPFTEHDRFIFLGETVGMPGHCTVARFSDGRVFINYHTDNFKELTEDEL